MAISTFPVASSGGTPLSQKVVRITSTQTWNCPADVTAVQVVVVSGGGGGGGHDGSTNGCAGGGGGGGGYVEEFLTVVPSTAYTITVGAGGTAGGSGSDGTQGGTSSFGALLSVTGGGFGKRVGAGNPSITTAACGGGHDNSNTGGSSYGGHGGGMGSRSFGPQATSAPAGWVDWQNGIYGYSGTLGWSGGSSFWSSVGINGYCGGGQGGFSLPNNSSGPSALPQIRISGAGWGATVTSAVNSASGSGSANTGGGGGGSARNNSFAQNAGAGGSGIVIITYWSAL